MNDTHAEDVEGLLERFREWLDATQIEAGSLQQFGNGSGPESGDHRDSDGVRSELGLVQLTEEFTALRHELKLQTKSGRGLLEQTEATIAAMRQAIEQIRTIESKEAQAAWSAGKVLAEALGDLDEALARGRREIEKAQRRIAEESIQALADALDEQFRRQSWIRRRMSGGYHEQVLDVVREAGRSRRELFDSLIEGYGLIQNRLSRVMKAERIERIPCEGNPVDPERMIVIEVVEDSGHPPGTVVKELRRGYTWKGRLLRYAEVQAASTVLGPAPEPDPGDEDSHEDESGLAGGGEFDDIGNGRDSVDENDNGIDLAITTDRNTRAGSD
jgi:molecular chaperone GrpE